MNLTADFLSIELTSTELDVNILFLQCRLTPEKGAVQEMGKRKSGKFTDLPTRLHLP